jgi:hypothetical protein
MAQRLHSQGQEVTKMKTKLIATLMLAASSMFAGPRIAIGVGVGVPIAPAPVVVAPPVVTYATPAPGPGYVWAAGYYDFVYGRRVWHPGFWRGPAFRPGFAYRGGYRGGFRR